MHKLHDMKNCRIKLINNVSKEQVSLSKESTGIHSL